MSTYYDSKLISADLEDRMGYSETHILNPTTGSCRVIGRDAEDKVVKFVNVFADIQVVEFWSRNQAIPTGSDHFIQSMSFDEFFAMVDKLIV